jgi:hypothetical protein
MLSGSVSNRLKSIESRTEIYEPNIMCELVGLNRSEKIDNLVGYGYVGYTLVSFPSLVASQNCYFF